jgi:UDP-glucose 4-epimerase
MLRTFWPDRDELASQSREAPEDLMRFDPVSMPTRAEAAMRGRSAVICLAGITPARTAATAESLDLNRKIALSVLRAARAAEVERVLLASSAAVYGDMRGALSEERACYPLSSYGRAKLEMEQEAADLASRWGMSVTSLRIGNVAGADAILGGWRDGMEIDTLPDGSTPRRSYIGPRTLARAMRAAAFAAKLPPVLNIAAPGTVAMGDLLDAAGLPWAPRPPLRAVIARVALSTDRLEKLMAFTPENSTPEGIVTEWRAHLAHARRPGL